VGWVRATFAGFSTVLAAGCLVTFDDYRHPGKVGRTVAPA
jgi:hypothetical protein